MSDENSVTSLEIFEDDGRDEEAKKKLRNANIRSAKIECCYSCVYSHSQYGQIVCLKHCGKPYDPRDPNWNNSCGVNVHWLSEEELENYERVDGPTVEFDLICDDYRKMEE